MIGAFNELATDNPIASSVRLAINSTHHPCSRLAARAARTPMAPQQIKRTLITAPKPTIVAFTPRNATTPATTNSTASNPRAMRPPRDDIIAPTITSLAAATKQNRRRAELDAKVARFHTASDGVYGAPRILADLRADGARVSRKTVAASLRRQGLAGISPRRFAPATTVVDLDAVVPKDLVRRRFDTGVLNRVWTSDITYLRTGEGWLYLCAVRDGCSRRVIGWAIDEYLHTDMVQAALAMAVAMRGELAEQVILHADRGCQYTSEQLARFADTDEFGESRYGGIREVRDRESDHDPDHTDDKKRPPIPSL